MQPTTERPARVAGVTPSRSAARQIARQQRERRAALAELRRIRKAAAAEIERLLDIIDKIDGDYDLEPSLGFVENHPGGQDGGWGGWPYYSSQGRQDIFHGNGDDREGDEHDGREPDCDDEDGGDDELSLCGIHADDGCGDGRDLEFDDSEMEPNLGWTESGAVVASRHGDVEGECEGDLYRGHDRDIQKAKKRQRKLKTIRTEQAFGGFGARHVLNLTDRQREKVAPRIDRDSHVRLV